MARILFVDDNAGVRKAVRLLLSLLNHQVELADSGASALAMYSGERFDVVITDLRMPRMNGLELARELAKMGAKRIALYSSDAESTWNYLEPEDKAIIQQAIGKPGMKDDLRKAIEELMEIP